MQLIKNIDLHNNYSSKISFKNNDSKNNYDILNQRITNNEIFEMREKAKQTNRIYNSLGFLSMAPLALLCQGDNYKKIEWKYMLFPAMLLGCVNAIVRCSPYSKKYKEDTINNELKKEKLAHNLLYMLILPTIELVRHTVNGTMKTKEAKTRGALGLGLSLLTGIALNFLKNINIKACEDEVNKLKKTTKAA